MPTEMRPTTPRTQPSAPAAPPAATEDPRDREADEAGWPTRHAGDESGERGDRMPMGADEPGAGL